MRRSEQHNRLGESTCLSIFERRGVVIDARCEAWVGAMGQQQTNGLQVALVHRIVQRRPIVETALGDVGALIQKQLHNLQGVTAPRREGSDKRGKTGLVNLIHIGPKCDELANKG